MNRVYIKTYGCQMNERDSEDVAYKLKEKGYELVSSEENADVILLNTCSVREQAENKAIGKAGHLLNNKKNKRNFILGIMGCMAQNKGQELFDTLPDLDLVVGTQKFHRIPEYIDSLTNDHLPVAKNVLDLDEELGSQDKIKNHLNLDHPKPTAFVSIMQGCNMNCSFCIVPKTRGRERYRSIESIVDESKELVQKGVREITLLGQIVNAYGRGSLKKKDNKTPFVQLLEKLNSISGLHRIRFTSPHPISFGDDLIHCYASLTKLCEYVHLPLQSGSNKILKLMNRPYTRERYLDISKKLRSTHRKMRLSTDVIVGFPGETKEDFDQTKSIFEEVGFEMAFVFKYSERSGTPAESYQNQVCKEIKETRNQVLLSLLEKQSLASNLKSIGENYEILVEGSAKRGINMLMGRTRCNRKIVYEGNHSDLGEMVSVKVKDVTASTLIGQRI